MTPTVYFNETDPYCCSWLRNLYPDAVIDPRSIADVRPADLDGYERAHFFGGIAGWEYALGLAGFPPGRPVWTGSCPCQPFSDAGQGRGFDDPRHLWPAFRDLVAECRPPVLLGEQVASRLGREWLARVRDDLEDLGYAVGAADLPACGVGAPHRRQRLFFVAHARSERGSGDEWWSGAGCEPFASGVGVVGDPRQSRLAGRPGQPGDDGPELATSQRAGGDAGWVAHPEGPGGWPDAGAVRGGSSAGLRSPEGEDGWRASEQTGWPSDLGPVNPWSDHDIIPCRDGKSRRAQSGVRPLAHGVPCRVGRLRGYGNAISPPIAAVFIRAFLDSTTSGAGSAPGGPDAP